MTVPDPLSEALALRAAQKVEYGTYVADGPINIEGVRAFNDGDPVPVGHVERGIVPEDQVRRVEDPPTVDAQVAGASAGGSSSADAPVADAATASDGPDADAPTKTTTAAKTTAAKTTEPKDT